MAPDTRKDCFLVNPDQDTLAAKMAPSAVRNRSPWGAVGGVKWSWEEEVVVVVDVVDMGCI